MFQGFSDEELQQLTDMLGRTAQNLKATLDLVDNSGELPTLSANSDQTKG